MPVHEDTSGYVLPNPVDNGLRMCVLLHIPDQMEHRIAFIGQIDALCHAYNWASDEGHNAVEVAKVWRGVFDDMMPQFYDRECGDMACCYDLVEHRVTSDGHTEIRINGGDWIPDPNDPRLTGIALPPPIFDETHTKCDAATNGKQHLEDFIAQESEALGASVDIFVLAVAIATAIVALFFGQLEAIPFIVPLILAAIPALIGLGQAAWDAYWTSDERDKILCALYCTMKDDGTFDQTHFDLLVVRLHAKLTAGVAADAFVNQVVAMGAIGVTNACSYGSSASADCSSCVCGCDLSHWIVALGTEISRTETEIVVQSVLVDGSWVAEIRAPDITTCCDGIGITSTENNGSPAQGNLCGLDYPGDFPEALSGGAGTCWNAALYFGQSGNTVGVVTFTVSGDCE